MYYYVINTKYVCKDDIRIINNMIDYDVNRVINNIVDDDGDMNRAVNLLFIQ